MAEYDPGGGLREGHEINGAYTRLELYRLLSYVLGDKSASQYCDFSELDPLSELRAEFLSDEISRVLILSAATLRLRDEYLDGAITKFESDCGVLIFTEDAAKEITLQLREACNKIIHAKKIRFDIENPESPDWHLNPYVYLYGDYRGKQWKVRLSIVNYVTECAGAMT